MKASQDVEEKLTLRSLKEKSTEDTTPWFKSPEIKWARICIKGQRIL